MRKYLFLKNCVTSEGVFSHNVLYYQQLSTALYHEYNCYAKTYDKLMFRCTGPPDNARITAETSPMTENEPVDLTCTADNGYPNDWSLAWFNGDIPLTNPGTAPSPQDTRFTFSSTLTFTPGRRDNGGSIICKAVRGAVTAAEGTFGPLDVRCRFVRLV